jgi:hypothetical protein
VEDKRGEELDDGMGDECREEEPGGCTEDEHGKRNPWAA